MHMYINTTNRRECRAVYSRSWFGEKLLKAQKIKKQIIKKKKAEFNCIKTISTQQGTKLYKNTFATQSW